MMGSGQEHKPLNLLSVTVSVASHDSFEHFEDSFSVIVQSSSAAIESPQLFLQPVAFQCLV